MKIALLSNINLDLLEDYLRDDFSHISKAGFNQYLQELINPDSFLLRNEHDIVLLHLDGTEYLQSYIHELRNFDEIKDDLDDMVELLFTAIQKFLARKNDCLFIMNTISINPYVFNVFLESNTDYSLGAIKEYVNKEILLFGKRFSNVLILDWEKIVDIHGYENLYDDKLWYIGRFKYTSLALENLSKEIRYLVNGYRGKIRKLIITDLDNTLWGGVIGEDGLQGILLSQEGVGKAYYDFQQLLKAVKKIGISLAICSKNNLDDVNDVFANHSLMVLKPEDFVSMKINWNDKVSNIKEIASDLNLGLDSFVFIDDNAVERNLVREFLPEVGVPEFPKDQADIKKWFVKEILYNYFPKVSITEEDKTKTEQYLANAGRKRISKDFNFQDFIRNLEIKLNLFINDKRFIERSAQMTQKTNQFSLTSRRYHINDIQAFLHSDCYYVFNLEYEDRLGKEGIIATAIVKVSNKNIYFDSFLLSCRVIGRNVEFKFMSEILDFISSRYPAIETVSLEYVPTKKNSIILDFLKKLDVGVNKLLSDDSIKKNNSGIDLLRNRLANIVLDNFLCVTHVNNEK